MTHFHYRLLFFVLILLAVCNLSAQAQRTLGVTWDIPESQEEASAQLEQFHELGISMLEVSPPVSSTVWESIEDHDFVVYGNLGIKYPISSTFTRPDSSLIQSIQKKAGHFLSHPSVEAIGLFEHGAIYQQQFREALTPFVTELKKAGQSRVYYIASSNQSLPNESLTADFAIYNIPVTLKNWESLTVSDHYAIGGYLYAPSAQLSEYLKPFKRFLEITPRTADIPVFVESGWLLSKVATHSQFKQTVQSISRTSETIFPVPNESIPDPGQSPLPIILLVIIWASVAIHYHSSPLYRKSLFRYFLAHKFFIEDIFHRHIRSASPAIILLLQNAVLIAAGVYAFIATSLSPLGLDALFNYFPAVAIFGLNPSGLAIWAFITSLAIALISITWLYISHKAINSFTQIATIYAWPLHINLVVCTIGLALFASDGNPSLISFFMLLTIPVQLGSFIISSFDAAKFIKSRTLLYISSTSVLYLILLLSLLIWGATTESWQATIRLAFNL